MLFYVYILLYIIFLLYQVIYNYINSLYFTNSFLLNIFIAVGELLVVHL